MILTLIGCLPQQNSFLTQFNLLVGKIGDWTKNPFIPKTVHNSDTDFFFFLTFESLVLFQDLLETC